MCLLQKSFSLLLLIFTLQADLNDELEDESLVLNYISQSVNTPQSDVETRIQSAAFGLRTGKDRLLSLETIKSVMPFITCLILLYFMYKISRLKAKFIEEINRIHSTIKEQQPDLKDTPPVTTEESTETSPPTDKHPIAMKVRDVKWLKNLDEIINNELSNELIKPLDLAEQMGICERQLQRKTKELTGYSPAEYLKQIRLKKGHDYLKSGDFQTISEVAYKVGYKCPDYFSKSFKKHFGQKPTELLNTLVLV
ncbi:MAG: helix-turn-helix transcriptional regulator [Roseivirga sp.]|nr:helix-turn-helix transcriptional regulator [Roseivirga sp.]